MVGEQVHIHDKPPEDEPPPKWHKKFFKVIIHDMIKVYRQYPTYSKIFLLAILILIILIQVRPLLWIAIFIVIDRIVVFLEKKTDFALGVEQVSIASILFGYYISLGWALLATTILQSMVQYRNNKITFLGILIDGTIWYSFCFLAYAMQGFSIGTVALILPIGRWLLKETLKLTLGYEVHDTLKDAMNMLYQIMLIRYLGSIIGILMIT